LSNAPKSLCSKKINQLHGITTYTTLPYFGDENIYDTSYFLYFDVNSSVLIQFSSQVEMPPGNVS
jgi:hypothetical protein